MYVYRYPFLVFSSLCCCRCTVDLSEYEVQRQHDLTLPLHQGTGSIRLLLVISGISAQEEVDGGGTDETMKLAATDYV